MNKRYYLILSVCTGLIIFSIALIGAVSDSIKEFAMLLTIMIAAATIEVIGELAIEKWL